MNIDIRTLILIIGITHLMQFLVFYNQFKANKSISGTGWWLLWSSIEVLGFIIILLRGIPSLTTLIIIFQDGIILSGGIFIYIGILKFFEKKVTWTFIAYFFASFLTLHLFFTFVKDDIHLRSLAFDAYISAIAFITAFTLYKNKTRKTSSTINFNIAVFVVHGGIFAYRTIMLILGVHTVDMFAQTAFNLLQYFDALAVGLLWTFGFIILINQRLNMEVLEAKAHFEQIFSTSPDAVLITRLNDGLFVDINDNFTKVFGYSKHEIVGKSTLDVNLWKYPPNRDGFVKMIIDDGVCDNFETEYLRKDGSAVTCLISAKAITLNETTHILSVIRDISARKEVELLISKKNDELTKISSDKDRFISILAHDLKAPFNIILGYLELLTENVRTYNIDKIENQIKIINHSAQNTYNLLEDILMWARSQSGKIPFNPQPLNLAIVCDEILEILRSNANAKGISISNEVDNSITVVADADMLKTILRNLISNAIKYTNKGGEIKLKSESKSLLQEQKRLEGSKREEAAAFNFQTISISDNGIGIDSETAKDLFDATKTITTRGTTNEGGTGLGLTLCKEFVEKHGGQIWVQSEVGKGSNFYFTLQKNIDNA